MLIDWFTVGAQVLNFLILVWLLKRFLYKPILHAIDAREKKIASELKDADASKTESSKERDEFRHKNADFDQQRAELMSKAIDEAGAERQRLLEEARKAADELSTKRHDMLRNEIHNLEDAIMRRTQQAVFEIARKALSDLASTPLEERMVDAFIRRLRAMGGDEKPRLEKALQAAAEPALVRSALELSADQRAAIQTAINETFSADIHIRFEVASDLVSGIELSTNGQKVAWSFAEYLASIQKATDEILKTQDTPGTNDTSDRQAPELETQTQ